MKISIAILEHYPEFENEVVNSVNGFNDIFLINDYNSKLENSNISLINAGKSLREKIIKAFDINDNDYILFIDGDDIFNNIQFRHIYNIIDRYNAGMFKFYSKKSHIIDNEKSIVYALNHGLDNHISGIIINTNMIYPDNLSDYSIDKQLFYYGLVNRIVNINSNYIIKRNNINSKMHTIDIKSFYYNTMLTFNKLKLSGINNQRYYANLVYDNNFILTNYKFISLNNFKIGFKRLVYDKYYKPLINNIRW